MRGKRKIGRILAGVLTTVMLVTSIPDVTYAAEAGTVTEMPSGQEEGTEETPEEGVKTEPSEEEDGSENPGQSGENEDSGEKKEDSEPGEGNPGEEKAPGEQEKPDGGNEDGDSANELGEDKEDNTEKEPDAEIGEGQENSEESTDEESVSQNAVTESNEKVAGNKKLGRMNLQNTISLQGNDSFGKILADEFTGKAEERIENNGYNVFSVEMKGQMATVSFETLQDAVLTVAIYDEAGKKLLASGSQEVFAEQRVVDVEIAETVPQYFYVRGFLTDPKTQQPLCPLYDSPMYTKDMQEFLAKTTDDFEEERVLNLDDDKTNNFAVYSEDAVIVPDKEGVNILVSADDENYIYVIENADESVTSLQAGDLFIYEYTEDVTLIVKVASIEVDGMTATITGEKLSMEEVFDYVRIDSEAGLEKAEIDASNLEDGVSYEGIVPYSDGDIETYKEWNEKVSTSFKLSKDLGGGVELSGSIGFNLEATIKAYIFSKYKYLEIRFDYSVKLEGSLSEGRKGDDALVKIPLAFLRIDLVPGVYVALTPNFVIEAEGKAGWSGTLKGTIGGAVSSDEGFRNLTSAPKFESEWKAEISVFLGISLKPEMGIINDKVAAASLEATVGVEIKAKWIADKTPSTSKIHECVDCIDGDIEGKISSKFKVQLLNSKNLSWNPPKVEETFHVADFYYSMDFNEFDWGKCPHYLYKIEVTVTDQGGNVIQGAQITTPDGFYVNKNGAGQNISSANEAVRIDAPLSTDEKGVTIGYLPPDEYKLEVAKEKYEARRKRFMWRMRIRNFE